MKTRSGKLIAVLTATIMAASSLTGALNVYAEELPADYVITEELPADEMTAEELPGDDIVAEELSSDDIETQTDVPELTEDASDPAVNYDLNDEEAPVTEEIDSADETVPETSGSVIRLYGSGIQKEQHIYFGRTNVNQFTYTDPKGGKRPYWRVLDPAKDNTGASGMFLMSEELWGNANDPEGNGGIVFNTSNSVVWKNSNAQNWCGSFYNNTFTDEEKGVIKAVSKSEPKTPDEWGYYSYGPCSLENEKVFFMSVKEIPGYLGSDQLDYASYYKNSLYTAGGLAAEYWLRTPLENIDPNDPYDRDDPDQKLGFSVCASGILPKKVNEKLTARPAFNINRSAILFASEATAGKKSNGVGAGALCAVDQRNVKDWRLTLVDSRRSGFRATRSGGSEYVPPGANITIQYSGAMTGANEYVSAIICDQADNILYYGRIANNSASGKANITLPKSVTEGKTYKVKVFSEQYNGDLNDTAHQNTGKLTDLASGFSEFSVKIPYHISRSALSKSAYNYNGSVHIPAVLFGGKTLMKNTDYSLTVKENGKSVKKPKNAGKYQMVLTGKGGYYGTSTKSYRIKPIANTLKVKAKKGTLTVKTTKLKKKKQVFKKSQVYKFTKKGVGKITYQLASVTYWGSDRKSKFSVDKKTGKFTVKKTTKLPTGVYKVKINVKAKGNRNYLSKTVPVTFNLKIKK